MNEDELFINLEAEINALQYEDNLALSSVMNKAAVVLKEITGIDCAPQLIGIRMKFHPMVKKGKITRGPEIWQNGKQEFINFIKSIKEDRAKRNNP